MPIDFKIPWAKNSSFCLSQTSNWSIYSFSIFLNLKVYLQFNIENSLSKKSYENKSTFSLGSYIHTPELSLLFKSVKS